MGIEIVAIAVLLGVPLAAGVWALGVWRHEHASDRVPVLCYHRLTCKADLDAGRIVDDEPVWTVLDTTFADQVAWLKANGYTTIDLNDFIEIRAGRMPAPERPIVLTFDDGYESVKRLAVPALRRHDSRAVVYAVLEPDAHTVELVAGLDRIMTADELREIAGQGVSIESHTVTHPILATLTGTQARWELTESKRRLEEITGKPVRHFCVPRAGGTSPVARMVVEAGYLTCSGLAKGTARLSGDPMRLPRIAVERHHDVARFARLLTPRHAFVHRILGDIRLMPTRLLGARAGYALRQVLYSPALRPLFGPHRLPWLVAAAALGWLAVVIWLLTRVV